MLTPFSESVLDDDGSIQDTLIALVLVCNQHELAEPRAVPAQLLNPCPGGSNLEGLEIQTHCLAQFAVQRLWEVGVQQAWAISTTRPGS